jgi:hypothetical protein
LQELVIFGINQLSGAISELCIDGEFRTLDLSAFGFQRIIENKPYAEMGIR